MASYTQGYDEDRFVTKVNRNFFCLICFNVLRDPVLCPKSQHCFCRSCITKYLETTQRCPTCADHLTAETLVDATRMVKDYLNESNIRCVYVERGCQKIVRLEQLDQHEATCGFTPVVCAKEGCGVIVSRRDLVHHENEVCEFRKLKCHSCEETAKTLSEMEKRMTKMEANMEKNKAELEANLKRDLESRFEAVNNEVWGLKAALVQCFDEMKDVLVKFDPDKKREIIREGRPRPSGDRENIPVAGDVPVKFDPDRIKEIITGGRPRPLDLNLDLGLDHDLNLDLGLDHDLDLDLGLDPPVIRKYSWRENILVAGGCGTNSVEKFNWHKKIWSPLDSLPIEARGATSFVYSNHVTIAGGYRGYDLDTAIRMNVKASPVLSTHWSAYPVKLPKWLAFHSSVVYNDKLIVTGGEGCGGAISDCIYEIQLRHPYTSKILSKMPEQRKYHGSAIFDDKLLIVGGSKRGRHHDTVLRSVLLYDVKRQEYQRLVPLPYEVSKFSTVKYGDNIVVIGGSAYVDHELNTVFMYNATTQQCLMLPPMKCKRSGSAAAVIGNNIVVMGGLSERRTLKSVEVFNFDSYTWSDLPDMLEEREYHTAVAL